MFYVAETNKGHIGRLYQYDTYEDAVDASVLLVLETCPDEDAESIRESLNEDQCWASHDRPHPFIGYTVQILKCEN